MRVISLRSRGYSVLQIWCRLQEENISVSRQAMHSLVTKFQNHRMCEDLPRRRRQQNITAEIDSFQKVSTSLCTTGNMRLVLDVKH